MSSDTRPEKPCVECGEDYEHQFNDRGRCADCWEADDGDDCGACETCERRFR